MLLTLVCLPIFKTQVWKGVGREVPSISERHTEAASAGQV